MGPLMTKRRARVGERGVVAVEFALVLPLIAMLLLGVLTAGIGFGQAVGLANAVREGGRFGATSIPSTATPPPYSSAQWTTWATDVNNRTRQLLMDAETTQATVCTQIWRNSATTVAAPTVVLASPVCSVGSQGLTDLSLATPPTIDPNTCVVMVWAFRQIGINAILVNFNPIVRRDSIARYERTC